MLDKEFHDMIMVEIKKMDSLHKTMYHEVLECDQENALEAVKEHYDLSTRRERKTL